MVGMQVHTLRETGQLQFVEGPGCAFKDLKPDHYWHANLSLNLQDNPRLFPVK